MLTNNGKIRYFILSLFIFIILTADDIDAKKFHGYFCIDVISCQNNQEKATLIKFGSEIKVQTQILYRSKLDFWF